MKWLESLTLFIVFLLIALLFDFAIAALVMWIWNMVVPFVFSGVTALTYWQAFGLCVLASLFKIRVDTNQHNKQ